MAFLVLWVGATQAGAGVSWKQFESQDGFSVMYPPTWFPIGISENRLNILSSEGGSEGVVIPNDQAEITVTRLTGRNKATLAEVAELDTRAERVLSRRNLQIGGPARQGCAGLLEITSKEEMGPRAYIVASRYCEIQGDRFVTILRCWCGDTRQRQYERTALRVRESFRSVK